MMRKMLGFVMLINCSEYSWKLLCNTSVVSVWNSDDRILSAIPMRVRSC